MVCELTINDDGALVIPAEIREQLGWQPGTQFRWEVLSKDELRLVPMETNNAEQNAPHLVRKNGHWVVPARIEYPVEDLVQQDREERIQELIRRTKASE